MEAASSPHDLEGELELVRQMCAGSERAFDLFVDSYVPGLLRFARGRLPDNPELARDVAQATVCAVIENLATFRGDASLRTWMYACCRNEIAAHFRRVGRRPREVELDEAAGIEEPSPDPEHDLLTVERSELVHEALERLPPLQARAMEWRYVDGLGVDEIARRLDATYKAAESMLSRGRAAFRRQYARLVQRGGATVEARPGQLGAPLAPVSGGSS